MAYLDEDILYDNIEEKYRVAKGAARSAYSDVLDTICEMPRADVVPKSEVDLYKRQVDELEDELASTYYKLEKAKTEVAREIFADIARLLMINFCSCLPSGATEHYDYFEGELADDIAELKKKYTEDKT